MYEQDVPMGATEACRESTLTAAHEDELQIAKQITDLEQTLVRLRDHLLGDMNQVAKEPRGIDTDPPMPPGILNAICGIGAHNIRRLREMQEFTNNLCYILGEGRESVHRHP